MLRNFIKTKNWYCLNQTPNINMIKTFFWQFVNSKSGFKSSYVWKHIFLHTSQNSWNEKNTTYNHIMATNGILHDAVHKLPLCSLLSKCHTVSQYVHSIISFKTHRKSTSFPVPIFMKPTNAQEHKVQIFLYWIPPKLYNICGQYR